MVRFIHDDRTAPAPGSGVRLRVIAAGAPRSATSSTQAALESLGYTPCLHMAEILPHPERTQLLLDIVSETTDTARRQKLLHRLVDGYAAVADLPVVFNTPDLMDMYPDVRVVLNQRPSGAVCKLAPSREKGRGPEKTSHGFGPCCSPRRKQRGPQLFCRIPPPPPFQGSPD